MKIQSETITAKRVPAVATAKKAAKPQGAPLRIEAVRTLVCDGGWRPWTFVAIDTSKGIVGYAEASESFGAPSAVVAAVQDLEPLLIGQDARATEALFSRLYRATRQSSGGSVQKAIAGVENALLDAKAKALGVPVYELFGGPTRENVPLYWSHFGTTRARTPEFTGKPALRTLADVARVGREFGASGYDALKTNLLLPGHSPPVLQQGFKSEHGGPDQLLPSEVLDGVDATLGALRDATGPDAQIALDVNFNFKPRECRRLAERVARHNLMWLEFDSMEPAAVADVRTHVPMPVCSGENLLGPRAYQPFLEARAMDIVSVDVIWNGLAQARKVATAAETVDLNVTPHNHYSHLATAISAHFCATISNVQILETDVDDVPWKDELVTQAPRVRDGVLEVPQGPGWGMDLDEDAVRRHPWKKKGA